MSTDQMLDADARLYEFRNYQSTMAPPDWGTLAAWKKQRQQIRRHLLLCAGLNAQTAAFRARGRVVDRYEHEGLVVENLCIETLPGLYLTGNLYRPKKVTSRLPLILHPHGHAMNARTTPLDDYSVPHRAMNSALLGFASFAYSMIGYDDDTRQISHRSLLSGPEKGAANTLGLSLFGLQLNNSIKALDYLLSRKEIDPERVGCTGESGGGTQTYFLAAVDERVKVAAPAVMLSGHMQGGCVCENAPGLHLEYSNLHYAGLIAPRPMLLLGCTGDWTHHMRERELPAMRQLYDLYKRPVSIDGFYQDEGHNYNRRAREAVYSWMVRWLMKGGAKPTARVGETETPVPARKRLLVFDKPIPPYKDAIRRPKQLFDMWQDLHRKPASSADVTDVLQVELPEKKDILIRSQPARHQYRGSRSGLYSITYGRFSQDSSIQARFLPPATKANRTLVLLRQWAGKDAWAAFCGKPSAPVRKLMDDGWGVVIPLLFGQQGSAPAEEFDRKADTYLATTYGKTTHMHQADDILTTVRMAQVEIGVQPDSMTLIADGNMGLITYAVWSFLHSQTQAGPLVADLGGGDLRAPATWAKRAYVPLLLGSGGIAGLAQLAGKGTGRLFGVRPVDRPLFPKTLRTSPKRASLAQLLAATQK
ncbi:MAG: hypothetical protein HOC05_11300 [Gemmatimonadetes bacterium]|jgi:dienelactone hydrolase|nr:hypothetical protein [Gemmatimonadota bacterium]MBT4610617.1 hypothetical protein [Gemmatimonadota bacterium]MBT5142173.1 hypothetical protein [Gemmatimonadota bacterium]MBT5589242.1 hypothetical protein [Gemmatimonadota bacterium]MBT5963108.1 hypothetical protein [Gemmatimonadota bacterium]